MYESGRFRMCSSCDNYKVISPIQIRKKQQSTLVYVSVAVFFFFSWVCAALDEVPTLSSSDPLSKSPSKSMPSSALSSWSTRTFFFGAALDLGLETVDLGLGAAFGTALALGAA